MGDIPRGGAAKRIEVHKTMKSDGRAVNCTIDIPGPALA
jgi:hypothetical protein